MDNENETREILQRLTRIETMLEGLGNPGTTATEALLLAQNNSKRLDKIDRISFWLVTTVFTGIILALLGLVLNKTA